MRDIRAAIKWENNNTHLTLELRGTELENIEYDENIDGENDENVAGEQLTVEYASSGKYFYLRVFRESTGETIFDTRLGPMHANPSFIQFTTLLATPYYYGLVGK